MDTDEITILVFNTALCNSVDITSSLGGYICEEGTLTLSATASGSGTEIYWYDAEFDGTLLGFGSTFETPHLTQTTSYWASEVLLEITQLTGQAFASPTTLGNSVGSGGVLLYVDSPIIIVDVEVFGTNATGGDITIELRDINDGNKTIASTTATITGGGNTTTGRIPHTIPLDFYVPIGNYRLVKTAPTTGIGLGTVSSANSNFPYPLGDSGEVTGGSTLTGTSVTQFFFFNWTIEEILFLCESARDEVTATVVDIDEVEATATQTYISPGSNTDLTASSTNTNYTYGWTWDGGSDTGATITVSPTVNTTYTVTATDSVTGCVATDEITILVFDTTLCNPLNISSTTGDVICSGETANLTAMSSGTGDEIYWYDAEFGGNQVGVGANFETLPLTSTKSYWATEVLADVILINPIETIFTVGSSNSVTSTPAAITFAIQNTNTGPALLTALENYMPANTVREHELWYHPTSLTGPTGTINAANGWIQIGGPQTTTSNTTDGISLVLDNLSFSIPANTAYRFALVKTENISGSQNFFYWGSGTVSASPNVFSDGGVILHVNDSDAGTGSGVVGYGGNLTPANTPRAFTGIIHIDPTFKLCESDRVEAIISVTSDAAPAGDTNQDFTAGDTLADLVVTGTSLAWYSDAAGTMSIPDTTPLVDGTTYYVSQTVNGCESQLLAITVTETVPGFFWENGAWTPSNPMTNAGPTDDVTIVDGTATFNANMDINNLTVNPGATLNIQNVLKVNGDITNNGSLVFVSNASTTGQLDVVPATSTITGEVTVQRYIPAKRAFRFLSSAVNSTTSINANLQEGATSATHNPNPGFGTHITGSVTGANGFDATPSGNPSIFELDNPSQQWVALPNTDVITINAGAPVRMMVRGDRSINLSDNNATPTNTTLRITGTMEIGTHTQSNLSNQAGAFNFFGNPYQAIVDMNSVITSSTNINSNFYYVWDPNMGTRGAYVTVSLPGGGNTGGSTANQYLQPGQAAFVSTLNNATAVLTFEESHKAVSQPQTAVFNITSKLDIRLYEATAFANNDMAADGLRLKFESDGNNAITSQDALKMYNLDENLATTHNGKLYSLESRTMPQIGENIALFTNQYRSTGYVFEADLTEVEGVTAYLLDNHTGKETELTNNAVTLYPFNVDINNAGSISENRFEIIFKETSLGINDEIFGSGFALFPNPARDNVFFIATNGLEGQNVSVRMHNILGQQVLLESQKVSTNGRLQVNTPGLPAGVYMVTLTAENGNSFTAKLINK